MVVYMACLEFHFHSYNFFSGQCCALSFIEKLDAQALSMSQEEFNR